MKKRIGTKIYDDAVKMFSFSAQNMGKTVYCGVSKSGKPFHGGTR